MNILVTGDRGFIASYVIPKLLFHGHTVVGIDNYSKHGYINRWFDSYIKHYDMDAANHSSLCSVLSRHNIDVVIANAALIGGIKYFHDYPFDIIWKNTEVINSTVVASRDADVKQLILISSSMVYETANKFPVVEGDELSIPPPKSTYGLQKLYSEYLVKSAYEQYGLEYTILRPFNAVGIGELFKQDDPGFAHVIPDLVYKVLSGQNPIEIIGDGSQVRSFTHAFDIANAVSMCIGNKAAMCQDFNLVNPNNCTSINNLVSMLMKKTGIHRECVYLPSFKYDVKYRYGVPDKAKEVLGWEPKISLDSILDEMITWVGAEVGYNI